MGGLTFYNKYINSLCEINFGGYLGAAILETWGSRGKGGPSVVLTGQVRFPLKDHDHELAVT